MCYVLAREDLEHYNDYEVFDVIQEGTSKVLTKLEKEFGAPTTHKLEEPEGAV